MWYYCNKFGCYTNYHPIAWYWFVIAAVVIYGLAILVAWLEDRYR